MVVLYGSMHHLVTKAESLRLLRSVQVSQKDGKPRVRRWTEDIPEWRCIVAS